MLSQNIRGGATRSLSLLVCQMFFDPGSAAGIDPRMVSHREAQSSRFRPTPRSLSIFHVDKNVVANRCRDWSARELTVPRNVIVRTKGMTPAITPMRRRWGGEEKIFSH